MHPTESWRADDYPQVSACVNFHNPVRECRSCVFLVTRTPEELRLAKQELAARFDELQANAEAADASNDERLGNQNGHEISEELADVNRRRQRVDAALAEIERLESEGEKVPARIPTTDPQSRVTPNKEGSFAPHLIRLWIGHSQKVVEKHHLTDSEDDDVDALSRPSGQGAGNRREQPAESGANKEAPPIEIAEIPLSAVLCSWLQKDKATLLGLEPRMSEPKSDVLPITP